MTLCDSIVIFGFSGSGKSTLAVHLGTRYAMRVIHPSSILRSLCEGKVPDIANTQYNTGFWESEEGIALFKSRLREHEPLDVVSDKLLVSELAKGAVVIDSWSLPWLSTAGFKLYLKADLSVRAGRVALRSGISYEDALDVVAMKDEETALLFKRVYGFDIRTDHDVFDYCIDTNGLDADAVYRQACSVIALRANENHYKKKTNNSSYHE